MTARRAITTPIALAAIVLLVINDHVLKAHIPGVLTGKLSDFAGMIFFPLLVAVALEHAGVRRGQRTVVAAAIATGLVFALIKLWDPAGDAYRLGLAALQWPFRAIGAVVQGYGVPSLGRAQLVADPTDLVALPALVIPVWLCSVSTGRTQRITSSTMPMLSSRACTGFRTSACDPARHSRDQATSARTASSSPRAIAASISRPSRSRPIVATARTRPSP